MSRLILPYGRISSIPQNIAIKNPFSKIFQARPAFCRCETLFSIHEQSGFVWFFLYPHKNGYPSSGGACRPP